MLFTNVNGYRSWLSAYWAHALPQGTWIAFALLPSSLLGQFQNKHGPKSKPLFLRLNSGHMDLMGRNEKERNIVRLTLWLNMSPMSSSTFYLQKKKERYRSFLKYMWIIAAFKWEDKKKKNRREGKISTRVQTTQGGLLSGSASPGLEQTLTSYLELNLPACFYK